MTSDAINEVYSAVLEELRGHRITSTDGDDQPLQHQAERIVRRAADKLPRSIDQAVRIRTIKSVRAQLDYCAEAEAQLKRVATACGQPMEAILAQMVSDSFWRGVELNSIILPAGAV